MSGRAARIDRNSPAAIGALADLGVTDAALAGVLGAPSLRAGAGRLEALKAAARKRFRDLALRIHPDMPGSDPERFIVLRRVLEELVEPLYIVVERVEVPGVLALTEGQRRILSDGLRQAFREASRTGTRAVVRVDIGDVAFSAAAAGRKARAIRSVFSFGLRSSQSESAP